MTTTSPLVTATSASRSGDRARLERLGDLSVKRAIEPDTAFAWGTLGAGAVLPDELLSTAGLDVELDADARARLSRAEVASMLAAGIRFEAVLNGILSTWIGEARRLDDPRFVYMLHEVAEETKHQRAFLRLIDELDATVPNPLERGPAVWLRRRTVRIARRERAFFAVLLLAGEEVPDHLQMLATEHPDTDPLLAAINRYHRAEEARHLSFARMLLRDHWSSASARERRRIRLAAPFVIRGLFESMVHPGVYRSVGLPAFSTWRAAHRTPQRLAMRYTATRPILRELVAVGAMTPGRIPRGWRRLCGVDASGIAIDA